jgi:hypothetical protein
VIRSIFQILLELIRKKLAAGEKSPSTPERRYGWAISSPDLISVGFRTVLTAWVEDDMNSADEPHSFKA